MTATFQTDEWELLGALRGYPTTTVRITLPREPGVNGQLQEPVTVNAQALAVRFAEDPRGVRQQYEGGRFESGDTIYYF